MENFLSNLPKTTSRKKKRVGRGLGSGRGSKSGRGTTRHQKAREDIPLHFEGGQARIVKKYPLLRGKGRNKSFKKKMQIISLSQLNSFHDGETVEKKSLLKKKIIESDNLLLKILANGKLERKLIVKIPISSGARKKVEDLGGKIEEE